MNKKDLEKLCNEPNLKMVLDALARYDARYIGNVPEKKARKLFPEMFKNEKNQQTAETP